MYYFHNHINGAPEELTDHQGTVAWRARHTTWGNLAFEYYPQEEPDRGGFGLRMLPQNIRLQGQYFDEETGLHYNTFRYYDPDVGRFTTPDPIGWIDPWGLSFMEMAGSAIERTGKKFQGAEIYKFTDKVKIKDTIFKKGDYFYLDNLHKDHFETFSKNDTSKGVFNLDGSKNERKSAKAATRKGPGC